MSLQGLAKEARKYCENEQDRQFNLRGACHENAIGTADYIRLNTSFNPLIVWGVVSHADESETADSIEEVNESTTHFWVELEEKPGIIDVFTNNPIVGDTSECIQSGIAYGGKQPDCYNTVQKFRYYGQTTPRDLIHKDKLMRAKKVKAIEEY